MKNTPRRFIGLPEIKTKRNFCLLVLALAISSFADLSADLADYRSQKSALEQELQRLNERITQTDSAAREEKRRFVQVERRQAEDIERRRAELDSLGNRITGLASELQKERARQGTMQVQIDNVAAFRTGIARSLAADCARLEALIERSLPWDREQRLDRVRALRRDLETGNATAEEALGRLRAIYGEEIRFGDEVTLVNRPVVRSDGETINARMLRIGNQWMVYSDEEGNRFGVLQVFRNAEGVQEHKWKEDLSFDERQAVRLALDVKMARKPPQVVRLPLSLAVATVEEK